MTDTDTDTDVNNDMIPRARLKQESDRRQQAQVGELEGELAALRKELKANEGKVSSYDSLVAQVQELQGKVKTVETARAEDLEILRAGSPVSTSCASSTAAPARRRVRSLSG